MQSRHACVCNTDIIKPSKSCKPTSGKTSVCVSVCVFLVSSCFLSISRVSALCGFLFLSRCSLISLALTLSLELTRSTLALSLFLCLMRNIYLTHSLSRFALCFSIPRSSLAELVKSLSDKETDLINNLFVGLLTRLDTTIGSEGELFSLALSACARVCVYHYQRV